MALDASDYSPTVKVRKGVKQPDMVNFVATKILPREDAEKEGWTTYFDSAPCRFGCVSAKFTKNQKCTDCWRVSQGRAPIYPKSKERTYYKPRAATAVGANGAPVVIAPSAPLEPTKLEQRAIAALAETRDIDAAAAAVGWSTGEFHSRVSSSPTFKTSVMDTCERLDIPWKRKPDASGFKWTAEIEQQFARRLVNTGLIEQVRTEFGIPASDFHDRLQRSSRFAALIDAAQPLAQITLRERALKSAEAGNDRLYKALADSIEENSISNMSIEQMNAEIARLLVRFDKQGLINRIDPPKVRHRVTGEIIDLGDYDEVTSSTKNNDLIGAP